MITKEEIVSDWLPRYTGTPLKDFGQYILLVNFRNYLSIFSRLAQCAHSRAEKTHAQCHCQWHHHDQLWHGQRECRDDYGFAQRDPSESGAVFR